MFTPVSLRARFKLDNYLMNHVYTGHHIGHSYSTRLGCACNGCLEQYLRVDHHISPILTYGISGAQIIESHLNKFEHYFRTTCPSVVIVELGTNDLQHIEKSFRKFIKSFDLKDFEKIFLRVGTCPLQTVNNLTLFQWIAENSQCGKKNIPIHCHHMRQVQFWKFQ